MKIRTGFVSNSSSQSFVCDISGETVSGWDMTLAEADMIRCERDHTAMVNYWNQFVRSHDLRVEFDEELIKNGRYEVSSKFCPICNLQFLTNSDLLKYLLRSSDKTRAEIAEGIRRAFGDHPDSFWDYIK
jgi:hypothetical protein